MEENESTYHAVEKDGVVTAIWEMQGRKHLPRLTRAAKKVAGYSARTRWTKPYTDTATNKRQLSPQSRANPLSSF